MRFIHTSDIHLGKTYRTSTGEADRYEDFFHCLDPGTLNIKCPF
jgi:exonuclease SbcD